MTNRTTEALLDQVLPDRVLYDAIDRAIRLMTVHLDRTLAPVTLDAIDAGDREAMRALLEDRLEPRFLRLSCDRAA